MTQATPQTDSETAILSRPPFNLGPDSIAWVRATKARLTLEEKVGQLFVFHSMGQDPEALARLAALKPAGITRSFTPDLDYEAGFIEAAQGQANVPLLVSADLEGSRMSLAVGTEVPNPIALAAVNDLQASRVVARIMGTEARAVGINWSFTPVVDLNKAWRSAIVATRGFGADIDTVEAQALAQIAEFQSLGVAATVKHWPGEGFDDRDQHLVTTINPLSMAEWRATFGRLYGNAIKAGVMSVMSAHIALPAYGGEGVEAYRPASVSRALNVDLLRGELGFNGVIVSDATPMAGFGAWGKREEMLPEVIENGCDIILFSTDAERDVGWIKAAVAEGRISAARLDEALTRVLGLKAWAGLHEVTAERPFKVDRAALGRAEAKAAAMAVTQRAPHLVKDVRATLPLSLARHRRVLVVSGGIVMPFVPQPLPFDLPQMLKAEGFEVTLFTPGMKVVPEDWDLMLYLFGEETLLTRSHIFLDWMKLTGHFGAAMARHWHDVPTVMISFGFPYYLYDAPRVPCYVNAWATMPSMQKAVLECLMGRADWGKGTPVDPFCGLGDARY